MSCLEADSTCLFVKLMYYVIFSLQDKPEVGAIVLADDLEQLGQSLSLLG